MAEPRLLTRPFLLVWMSSLLTMLGVGMLLPVLPLFAKTALDAGDVGVGLAIAASTPTAALLQPFAGRLADRHGRRPLFVAGPVIYSLALLALLGADSLPMLLALRALAGVGEAAIFVTGATMINDLAPAHRRGEAFSIFSLATWGGLAAGPALGELVLEEDRFRAVWVAAAIAVAGAALLAQLTPETRPSDAPTSGGGHLLSRAAILPGLAMVGHMWGFAAVASFTALYARDLGMAGAGGVLATNAGVVLLVRSVGRKLPDRLGARRGAAIGLSCSAGGLAVIAAIQQPVGLYAGVVAVAIGHGLLFPAIMMMTVALAPPAERSSAVGSLSACTEAGYAVAAIGLGFVAAAAGYPAVYGVAAVCVALGLAPLTRIPRTPRATVEAASEAPP